MSVQDPQTILGFNVNDPEQKKEMLEKLSELIYSEGIIPKNALQISDETMEDLYHIAYHLYNNGKLNEALDLFRHLMILDYSSYRFALGAAACSHRLKDYNTAILCYSLAMINDPTNPLPAFYGADCYLELENWEGVSYFCQVVIAIAADQPQFASLRERAQLLNESVQRKLHRDNNNN